MKTERENGAKSPDESATGSSVSVTQLDYDTIFGLLSNQRRRLTVDYLAERKTQVGVTDLAEHIASIEQDKPVRELSSEERKSVYVSLYQSHLPKLEIENVIEYNKSEGMIDQRPEMYQLVRHLPDVPE